MLLSFPLVQRIEIDGVGGPANRVGKQQFGGRQIALFGLLKELQHNQKK